MAQRSKLTDADKKEIVELHNNGMPYAALAAKYNVSSATIMRTCKPEMHERQRAANRKYQARNKEKIYAEQKGKYKKYMLSYHVTNDATVIKQLDKQDSVMDYVRQLVINDTNAQDAQKGND